ncbi:MAG: hypothetical protein ABI210_13810 [Abditibacteriaceae bacterium]
MSNSSSVKSSRGKVLFISLIIAILIAIGLYVAGLMKGRAEVSVLQSQLTQAQAHLAISQNQQYLMQADAALYHTAIDLDQRNFGTANDRLKEAADALGKVTQDSTNLNLAGIAQLRSSITALNINVAVNLEDQRTQVLTIAMRLDNLIGDKIPAG